MTHMARRPQQRKWIRVVALVAVASMLLLAVAAAVAGTAASALGPGVTG